VSLPLSWGALLVMFLLTAVLPVGAAFWLRLRLGVPLRVFEIAAGFYLVNLVVQVPIFQLLRGAGLTRGLLFTAVIAPAIYAACEEGVRYLSFRAGGTMRAYRTADGALMAGLGHGGMEAILFGISLAWTVAMVTFAPDVLRANGVDVSQTIGGLGSFFGAFSISRVSALVTHLGFATLTVMAYRRSTWFLAVAFLAHFAVDCSTFGLQAVGGPPWWVAAFVFWAAVSALFVASARRADPVLPATQPA
jgi:uncharacterized membrane protein YhfC